MQPRLFLDIDPRVLHVLPSRINGADPGKLQRQISRFGKSIHGMPTLEATRGSDGELMINDGVTRATRVAKLLPGATVRIEVIDDYPAPFSHLPTIEDTM